MVIWPDLLASSRVLSVKDHGVGNVSVVLSSRRALRQALPFFLVFILKGEEKDAEECSDAIIVPMDWEPFS